MAKALDENSSKYDLDKLDSEIDNMKTYLSFIEAAGQILLTQKGVTDPARLMEPNNILEVADLELWINQTLTESTPDEAG